MSNNVYKKNSIAVCCATLREHSVLEPMDAICQRANEAGLNVQIFQSFEELYGEAEIINGEKSVFELINYDMLCGMIIFGERIKDQVVIDELIKNAKEHNLPVVSIDRHIEGCFNVTFDYADAFEGIVKHLVEVHNFKKFFVMAGMRDNAFSDERIQAVKNVLTAHNLELDPDYIDYGDFWDEPTRAAMDRFFESGKPLPDAFIALNDSMATVVIDELQKHGYYVPGDVAVTGFDGLKLAEYYVPKITTAKQQFDVAGKRMVEIILEYMKDNSLELFDEQIPFTMQLRQSCGCEKVDLTGVTENIRELYTEYDACKRYGGYMDEMTRSAIGKGGFNGLLDEIRGYSVFVDCHNKMYLCAKKDYVKQDRDYYSEICSINPALSEDNDEDMLLLAEKNSDRDINYMISFSSKDLLPDIEKKLDEMKNVIIMAVHSGHDIYGYMIADFVIGNKDTYKTKMFINKVSTLMLVLKQRIAITNTNIALTEVKERLEQMYVLDPMTGIYNRRGFYQKYDEFLAEKNTGYVTVFSVDLDRLKMINDTYGHQEGDFAIKALGEALTELVGDGGICARFGGDEFVALVYHSEKPRNEDQLVWIDMMERLKAKKEAAKKPYDLQCSLGGVQSKITKAINIESLISKSDKVLYEMKRKHHEAQGC